MLHLQVGSYQEHGISLCDISTVYGICHCCLICTALVIGMYYTLVQELVILYIEVSDSEVSEIPGKTTTHIF